MSERMAFFDVDTRGPDPATGGIRFGDKVKDIADKLAGLLRFAQEHDIIVLATACVNAGLTRQNIPEDALFIPDMPWDGSLDGYRTIFLEKKTCGSREANLASRAFDAFCANPNTAKVVDWVGEDEWVVFGRSPEHCVPSTVEGLLRQNRRVTLLEDVTTLGKGGEEAKKKVFAELADQGARLITLETFMREQTG